jgi:tetratricopeptide (TPR) repeat protein
MKKVKIIENYLEGNLELAEKLEFEKMLVIDKDLSGEIKLHKEVNDAIRDDELFEFRQKVNDVVNSISSKITLFTTFSGKLIKYPVAASIILLIAISLWQVLSLDSPEKIFSDYYEPYPPDISTRSINTTNDKIQLACLLYQEGDYNKSYHILKAFLLMDPDNQAASFYLGLNAIELANYNTAIAELRKIESDKTTPFSVNARWYLALTYLKTNNVSEARKCLSQIVKDGNYYSEKAGKILRKLKS